MAKATKERTPAVGDPVIWYGEIRHITGFSDREWNDRTTCTFEDVAGKERREAAHQEMQDERAKYESEFSDLTDTQKGESQARIKELDKQACEVFFRVRTPLENLVWVDVDGGAWTTPGRILSDAQKEAFKKATGVPKVSNEIPHQLAARKYLDTMEA